LKIDLGKKITQKYAPKKAVDVDTTITSKPNENPFINVDDCQVQKQVDHNNASNSFHMLLVNVMDELILGNINDPEIPILEHVQSDNVNVESHSERPNLATLEHVEIIAQIVHNNLETNENRNHR